MDLRQMKKRKITVCICINIRSKKEWAGTSGMSGNCHFQLRYQNRQGFIGILRAIYGKMAG